MIIRASAALAALIVAGSFATSATADLPYVASFSFRTRDVSHDALREIAVRVAAKHKLNRVGEEPGDGEQAGDRIPIVEFRRDDTVFYLALYKDVGRCVLAEIYVWGHGGKRGAAKMREDLQAELTAALGERVQLHNHISCGFAL